MDGNNKNFIVKKVFVAFFPLKDEFNKSAEECGFHDFSALSTCFIPSSLAQLDVTKFSKTLSTLARDGLGTATLQVSHLPNTLLL